MYIQCDLKNGLQVDYSETQLPDDEAMRYDEHQQNTLKREKSWRAPHCTHWGGGMVAG